MSLEFIGWSMQEERARLDRYWPRLDLLIPAHVRDQVHLAHLLRSLSQQRYPMSRVRIHVITEGHSEEAKALGVRRSVGEVIGFLCADNELREPDFLRQLVAAATQEGMDGAYTAQYAYIKDDASLSRYFALLGANDPLCWWLGKADRQSYLISRHAASRGAEGQGSPGAISYRHPLPSLGDNGFFTRRALIQPFIPDPTTFGSTMDLWEDIRQANGSLTFAVVSHVALWHRSGEGLGAYLRKRWRYVNALYWDQRDIRRWHMVGSLRDWAGVVGFAVASLLVVPHLFVSLRGYRSKPDRAWLWHPVVCGALTLLYACAMIRHLLWSCARGIARRS